MAKLVFDWADKDKWKYDITTHDQFKSYYTHIRAYHGCRTSDVSSYYSKGIMVPNESFIKSMLEELPGYFDALRENFELDSYDKGIFFVADKRHLLECCGHYMIYGSEIIAGVAVDLDGLTHERNMNYLKSIGKPTILTCDIPMSLVADVYLDCIAEAFITSRPSNVYTGSLVTRSQLSPEFIVKHEHPRCIFDPLSSRNYEW